MQHYRFTRAVTVEGVEHAAETVVTEDALPAGCLKSLLWVQHVVPCDPPPPAPPPVTDPEPAPAPAEPTPKKQPWRRPKPATEE